MKKKKLTHLIPSLLLYLGNQQGPYITVFKWHSATKFQVLEGIELLKSENIRTIAEKDTCKYLGLLEADSFKKAKMKEKVRNKVPHKKYKTSRN